MNKLLSIFISILVVGLFSCSDNSDDKIESENIKRLSAVHNFTKYKAIGAGVPSGASRSVRTAETSGARLVGQNENGTIEVVTFDDESGAEKNQTYYLSQFTATDNFCFMGFSEYSSTNIESKSLYTHGINYMLDKRTGKMYPIEFENSFDIGAESNGKVICGTTVDKKKGIYFYSVENNLLKIELIVDYDTLPIEGYVLRQKCIVDRYENAIIGGESKGNQIAYYIVCGKSGKVKKINSDLNPNINGIFYDSYTESEISSELDENGDLIPVSFRPDVFIRYDQDTKLIRGNGFGHCVFDTKITDDEFYFWDTYTDGTEYTEKSGYQPIYYGAIAKITFTDSEHIKYKYEYAATFPSRYKGVDYPEYYFDSVGKVLYISDDLSVITFLDVMKNEYTDVLSLDNVMRVKSVEKDEYGNVVITYIDNNLNTVNYYIDTDGNYSTSFTKPEFIVKYISPIN